MSSRKDIRSWNRFEIAFNEEMRAEAEACKRAWRKKWEAPAAPDAADSPKKTPTTRKTSEKTPFEKGSFAGVRSLWEEARRLKIDAETKNRVDSALKSDNREKSTSESEGFPFGKPRRRAFRASEPPRRFDRPRRDEEEGN